MLVGSLEPNLSSPKRLAQKTQSGRVLPRQMLTRGKITVFVGFLLIAASGVLLMHDFVQPVGILSRGDVIEIRKVVTRAIAPDLNSFVRTNFRFWPTLFRMRCAFQITDIRPESISTVEIHPDGTREQPRYYAQVGYVQHRLGKGMCRVVKEDVHWVFRGVDYSGASLFNFAPKLLLRWAGPRPRGGA
jgi:hypothetical protein